MIELLDEEDKVQPEALKSIVEDFSDNDDYRKCTMCGNHKLSEEFYQNKRTGYYHSRCKPCHNNYSGGKLSEYYQKKFETQGGSERILPKPGTYTDIYQEQQVSWLLDLIGWSKDNDVWVKEGIKTVQDGKIVWDKIPVEENLHYVTKRLAVTDEQIAHIVQLRSNGFKMREIAVIYNCSRTTIGKILSNEEKRNG